MEDLLGVAEHHDGVITYAQALAAGYSPQQIKDRVTAGAWDRMQPRTFRIRGAPNSWKARVRAAIADNEHLVASHGTSAALLDLERAACYTPIEVTRPGPGRPRRYGDVLVHRSRTMEAIDLTTRGGVRCTTGERTLIDLARRQAPVEVLATLDDAIGRRVADREVLFRRSTALVRGRKGVTTIVHATAPGAEAAFRSWLERTASAVFSAAGLPPARFNHELRIATRTAFADVWWPPDLVVELNGLRFHDLLDARRRDSRRNNDLTIGRYRVLVFTYADIVNRPNYVVATIRRALAAVA